MIQIAQQVKPQIARPDAYLEAWQSARDDAASAYLFWSGAEHAQRRDAYAVYVAAADREHAAAAAYARATG
jgi:hypothetical protein